MIFLHSHKITTNLAVKIFKTYGNDALAVLREIPTGWSRDIYGVGFKTADRIARDLGLPVDHPSRIEAGIAYVLEQSQSDGHVFCRKRCCWKRRPICWEWIRSCFWWRGTLDQ